MNGTQLSPCLVALGGNLRSEAGRPEDTLRAALSRLEQRGVVLEAVSRLYRTPCFPAGAGPDYVNAAARIRWPGDARSLLRVLHDTETEFGRARTRRWGRRTLDLDLIAMGDLVLPDREVQRRWRELRPDRQAEETPDQLILPHPRLQDRAFVLVPLCDVAPLWRHPVTGSTIAEMAAELPAEARQGVVPL